MKDVLDLIEKSKIAALDGQEGFAEEDIKIVRDKFGADLAQGFREVFWRIDLIKRGEFPREYFREVVGKGPVTDEAGKPLGVKIPGTPFSAQVWSDQGLDKSGEMVPIQFDIGFEIAIVGQNGVRVDKEVEDRFLNKHFGFRGFSIDADRTLSFKQIQRSIGPQLVEFLEVLQDLSSNKPILRTGEILMEAVSKLDSWGIHPDFRLLETARIPQRLKAAVEHELRVLPKAQTVLKSWNEATPSSGILDQILNVLDFFKKQGLDTSELTELVANRTVKQTIPLCNPPYIRSLA